MSPHCGACANDAFLGLVDEEALVTRPFSKGGLRALRLIEMLPSNDFLNYTWLALPVLMVRLKKMDRDDEKPLITRDRLLQYPVPGD